MSDRQHVLSCRVVRRLGLFTLKRLQHWAIFGGWMLERWGGGGGSNPGGLGLILPPPPLGSRPRSDKKIMEFDTFIYTM